MVKEASTILVFLIDCGLDMKDIYIPISTNITITKIQHTKTKTYSQTTKIKTLV